jgi:hypothetical protein
MTDDPLHGSSARYGDLLTTGRVLHETLTSIEHYRDALNVIETLDHAQLAHLALYVAADAAATRGQEQASGQVWIDWWRGVDSLDADSLDADYLPAAGSPAEGSTPGMLWYIVRPDRGDDPDRAPNT